MSIEYIFETMLLVGFMLFVLVVCKWFEDFRIALKLSRESGQGVWSILVRSQEGRAPKELIDQEVSEGSVVYLKVSNPKVPVKVSIRHNTQDLAMKKAANSE